MDNNNDVRVWREWVLLEACERPRCAVLGRHNWQNPCCMSHSGPGCLVSLDQLNLYGIGSYAYEVIQPLKTSFHSTHTQTADLLDLAVWTLELLAGPNRMLVEWVLRWAAEVRVLVEALEYRMAPGCQVVLGQSQMRPGWVVPCIPTCEPAIIPQKQRISNNRNKLSV